ncbi:hypothetical protein DFH11DRAFT_1038295 [Phellopilus nigrolimitatus]|nr:hypothetical protein DFH11DRAFT_1038295 [Phellopilus nigrolimitatus]
MPSLTNLTIDDTSVDIIYSQNWAVQSAQDPNTDQFFQSTYHSAQADGASANITFTGSSIYLFGSKGPGHANYSVQFDNLVIYYSGIAETTEYQAPLFGYTFTNYGTHFVSLTSHFTPNGEWLDLDYLTISVNETGGPSSPSTITAASGATTTQSILPPWLSNSSSSSASSSTGSVSAPSSTSSNAASSPASRPTLISSIVLGTLLAALLAVGLGFCITRRKRRSAEEPAAPTFSCKPTLVMSALPSPAIAIPDIYGAQSPSSRTDPFHREPGLVGQLTDGRQSPWSVLSQGNATVVTSASTTQLLNAHQRKMSETRSHSQSRHQPREYRGHTPGAASQQSLPLSQMPLVAQHRAFDSDSAIALGAPGSAPQTAESGGQFASQPPGHSTNHSDSTLSLPLGRGPKRPKRPGEGLLEWLGNGIRLERSASRQRRMNDENSERTDFLKV